MPPIRPSLICERIEAQLVAQGTAAAAQKSTGLDSAVLNVEILWEIRQAQVLLGRLMLGVLVRLEFPAFNVACVQFRVVLPFFWQIIERKNCGDGANGHTSSAIDALHGVNVKLRDFVECWPTVVVGRVLLGWMQSTGHASTQAVSFTPMQGSAMTYAMKHLHMFQFQTIPWFGAVSRHLLLYDTPQKGQCVRRVQKDLCTSRLFL